MTGRTTMLAWMRPSFQTDLAQLKAGVRHVVRSELADGKDSLSKLRAWARRMGLFAAVDRDGFFTLSCSPSAARRALHIDRLPGRHETALGQVLGYPLCCCRAAARQSEACIDEWALSISKRRFIGLYRLIHPGGYSDGQAILSHVPCSPRCRPSLQMALTLLAGASRPWLCSSYRGTARVVRR